MARGQKQGCTARPSTLALGILRLNLLQTAAAEPGPGETPSVRALSLSLRSYLSLSLSVSLSPCQTHIPTVVHKSFHCNVIGGTSA